MNMQRRSEIRSLQLHKEIAKKLRSDSNLWAIPKRNLERWKNRRGNMTLSALEWEHILDTHSREQILGLLENDSEESIRLRSSSPFTGILDEKERRGIFDLYKDG